jgi:hypothetical protein
MWNLHFEIIYPKTTEEICCLLIVNRLMKYNGILALQYFAVFCARWEERHDGQTPSKIHPMKLMNTSKTVTHRKKRKIRPTNPYNWTYAWLQLGSNLESTRGSSIVVAL